MTAERNLIKRLNASDEEAFAALYDKYVGMVYNYILSVIKNVSLAEELTQQCFIQVWEHRTAVSAEKNFPAWLYVIARNSAFKEIRRQVAAAKFSETISPELSEVCDDSEAFESWDMKRMQNSMMAAINSLPDARRKIYILKTFKGKSVKEIAELLDISPKTVENQLTAARKFLKEKLSDFMLLLAFLSIHL